jgi:oligopeptide transport system substrate-binding protein
MAVLVVALAACSPAAVATPMPTPAAPTSDGSPPGAPATGATTVPTTACQAPTEPPAGDGSMAAEQVLRLPLGDEVESLDPTLVSSLRAVEVMRQLHHPLVYFDQDLNTVPGLAERWDISTDGTEITFHLREANYSNGDPIVAGDLVYSWRRLVDPRVAAEYAYVMEDLAGASALLELDAEALPSDEEIDALLEEVGVSAPDDRTFVVQLAQPASYFISVATLWVTVPIQQAWIESENATDGANYVASGPFDLESWEPGSSLTLVRNPEWFGEAAKLERIEFTLLEDELAALNAYVNDELDMVAVPSTEIARICADPALKDQMLETATAGFEYYGFDLNDPEGVFARSPHLRRAFAMAVDKQTLVDTVRQGAATVAGSAVPPGIPGHQPDIGLPYDPVQAQAELQEGLAELGLTDASELDLTVGYNVSTLHEQTVDFLTEQWRTNLGVEVESEGLEAVAYSERRGSDPFDINRASWTQDYPHPNNFLGDVFGTGNNFMGYSNEEFDDLMSQAAAEAELDAQVPIYEQAQELLVEEAPVIWLYWYGGYTLVKPHVHGLVPTTTDEDPGMMFFNLVSIGEH